ncbi:MAG: hypothetical protein JKY53_10035 [Flavobacteriales bacterium]|nr:hypothetical protein [Flavobacteriales bacterium]
MNTHRQILQYDEELGHKYVPNQFARLRYGNDGYFIETDSMGFRNSPKKHSGQTQILLIGDSFAAGDSVSNENRFSDILEKNSDCSIVNLAVSGYGIDQQILAYQKYGHQIEHDIVLFMPHVDDLKRNLMPSRLGVDKNSGKNVLIPKPYFTIVNGELKLLNVPVPRERKMTREEERLEERDSLKSKAINYLNYRVKKKQIFPELCDINSSEWQLMAYLIKKLKILAKDKLVIVAPFPYYISVTYNENAEYIKLFKRFESEKFKVLDPSVALKNNFSIENNTIFQTICGHFTKNGNEIIANYLQGELGELVNLKERHQSSSTEKNKNIWVLGLSCFYHDSAASLIKNGKIIAAAQEERFTRVKHDKVFPSNAINYCLEEARIDISDIDAVVYYDIESWTIERVMHNVMSLGDLGEAFWNKAKRGLYQKFKLAEIIRKKTNYQGKIFKSQHHISHAAGAFYPSPFKSSAILIIDGVGEWACSTIGHGIGNKISIIKQQNYPHSLGLLYSAFTYFCGFKVNSGEYKLMGLAPYGEPHYVDLIKKHIVTIKNDGSIFLDLNYFSFMEGEAMTNEKFANLFGGQARSQESEISQREMDLASSIQKITEEIVIKMANHAHHLTGEKNLVMSGGVALNCVSNGKLFDETPFDDIYFQPASGDAGGATGCALEYYHKSNPTNEKIPDDNAQQGPRFTNEEVCGYMLTKNLIGHKLGENRAEFIANLLANNKIVGYFDGRMEFGPRALGNRSILANPLNSKMQSDLNLKIKFRESFRPFAPIFTEEQTKEYFDFDKPSPYMLIVRGVNQKLLKKVNTIKSEQTNMVDLVNQERSEIPAITHVDNSARLQSVNSKQNPRLYDILKIFGQLEGKEVLINTSFNVRGEPIVCTINDAYKCFMRTNMDVLVLNDYYLLKEEQPKYIEYENWQETFQLD